MGQFLRTEKAFAAAKKRTKFEIFFPKQGVFPQLSRPSDYAARYQIPHRRRDVFESASFVAFRLGFIAKWLANWKSAFRFLVDQKMPQTCQTRPDLFQKPTQRLTLRKLPLPRNAEEFPPIGAVFIGFVRQPRAFWRLFRSLGGAPNFFAPKKRLVLEQIVRI